MSWAKIKRRQADDADGLAAVASGIGEYEIANSCYRLAGLLRRQAQEIDANAPSWPVSEHRRREMEATEE